MAKQPPPSQAELHTWAIYHLKGTKFVGLIHNQPDGESAINQAIEEYNVPPNERGRLIAQRCG